MSEHQQFTIDTGMTVYFAHPGAPWERGTNENTHGLLWQYVPKGRELSKVSTREIKRVQRELNPPPVFPGLRHRIWPHLLLLVTNGNVGQAPSQNPVMRLIDNGVARLCERLLNHDPPTVEEVCPKRKDGSQEKPKQQSPTWQLSGNAFRRHSRNGYELNRHGPETSRIRAGKNP